MRQCELCERRQGVETRQYRPPGRLVADPIHLCRPCEERLEQARPPVLVPRGVDVASTIVVAPPAPQVEDEPAPAGEGGCHWPGCTAAVKARGLCTRHRKRGDRIGLPTDWPGGHAGRNGPPPPTVGQISALVAKWDAHQASLARIRARARSRERDRSPCAWPGCTGSTVLRHLCGRCDQRRTTAFVEDWPRGIGRGHPCPPPTDEQVEGLVRAWNLYQEAKGRHAGIVLEAKRVASRLELDEERARHPALRELDVLRRIRTLLEEGRADRSDVIEAAGALIFFAATMEAA